ncbi:tight adherence pilus pseudopilin TadF [Photobacterium nomapromontoriensis]|uniref:tight adherence pilus pseudopilin TadF n=1 Tax=Photobacterium nomapromontoriensis TaxID=2910237 RepID=UPI003D0B6370
MTRLSRKQQQGVFAIELVFVLLGLCVFFLFVSDLSHKLLTRSQLDRTSFALVNILKERTRYYADVSGDTRIVRYALNDKDNEDMQILAARMLNVSREQVAVGIESLVDKQSQYLSSEVFDRLNCKPATLIKEHGLLIPKKKNEKTYPLYQVTLCARHDGWFLPFISNKDGKVLIVSSSVIAGR